MLPFESFTRRAASITVNVKVRLNRREVFYVTALTMARQGRVIWGIATAAGVVLVLNLVRTLASHRPSRVEEAAHILQNLLPLLVVIIGCPVILIVVCYFWAGSKLRNNAMLGDETRYSFLDEVIRAEGPKFKSEMAWSGLKRVEERRSVFLFSVDKSVRAGDPEEMLRLGERAERLA